MIYHLVSLFDKKAAIYHTPMAFRHKNEAYRAMNLRANDKTHPIGQFPSDYALYEVGTFDDTSCQVELATKPAFMLEVSDLVTVSQ